ncbi:MAG: hypothetical protein HGA87_01350 [Desulfobulbaceae bacterium]|nr:hypothetical protein [Desulfobulbaceae bacterium]
MKPQFKLGDQVVSTRHETHVVMEVSNVRARFDSELNVVGYTYDLKYMKNGYPAVLVGVKEDWIQHYQPNLF